VARLRWTRPALDDLRDAQNYIARDSRAYARRTGRQVRAAASRLKSFPESGRFVPEFPGEGFREVIVGQYRVIYRYLVDEDLVAVMAVSHGARPLSSTILDL